MNIDTSKFKVTSGLGWGHRQFHKKVNALAEEICYKAKRENKNVLALLMELATREIPCEISNTLWTGDYEGEIFHNRVVNIKVGTEGTELWVYCN